MFRNSVRRKISINKKSILDDEHSQFQRNNTNTSVKDHETVDKKIIADLQKMLKQEKFKRQELQEQMEASKNRNLRRQKQFYRILQTTHNQMSTLVNDVNQKGSTAANQILKLFSSIYQKFEESNEATHNFIEKQYIENLGMMERRIFEITQNFNTYLSHHKKLSQDSYRRIRGDLESVIQITKKIQDQNVVLKQKLDQEAFKNKVLIEEKQLLIGEMVQKKKVITKLYQDRKSSETPTGYFKADSKMITISATRSPDTKLNTNTKNQGNSVPHQITSLRTSMELTRKINPRLSISAFKDKGKANQSLNFNSRINQMSRDNKIISHLKMCLGREKRRVLELGKLLTKIQIRNSEINQVLAEILLKAKEKGSDDQEYLNNLVKSEKLVQTIKDLKKRLSTCEYPPVACGWGQLDFGEIVQLDGNQTQPLTSGPS